jgi:integrase
MAGPTRITLHECRHTFASLMIAAGVNAKALSTNLVAPKTAAEEAARAAGAVLTGE